MSSSQSAPSPPSCATLLQSFLQVEGLPFAEVLTEAHCYELFQRHGLAWDPTPAGCAPSTATADSAAAVPVPVATEPCAAALTPAADGATCNNPATDTSAVPATVSATVAAAGELVATTASVAVSLPEVSVGHAPAMVPPCPLVPRSPVWTTSLTVWTFLYQVLSTSKACTAAALRGVVLRTMLGCRRPSKNPGAYRKARGRLPTGLLTDLSLGLAVRREDALPPEWRWLGQRVLLAAGWVVLAPATVVNQAKYPQPTSQKPGAGFPQVRLTGLFSHASGLWLGVKYGPCQGKETGETALLRELLDQLRRGDVLVADRYYCSYFLILLLQQRGVEVVFHLHQRRKHAFGNGQALGAEDEIVVWEKPKCPDWMDEATSAALPATLEVRSTATRVDQRGLRTQ
ncbi:MAG: transposase [Planctomycetes bacterium]|nr:transposase [Planctomycetota bacterium]